MQMELTKPGPLLNPDGRLAQVGWARQPLLDSNLENAHFYSLRALQFLRLKRWDYYAFFTPQRFFSATIADLGYAANIFVYTLDFATGDLHEEGLVIPLSKGVSLPRNSTQGDAHFCDKRARLDFQLVGENRNISVSWPSFQSGRGIAAEISLHCPPQHESMAIVIPIQEQRFYYNRKVNCLPATGHIQYGDVREDLTPDRCLGSLDWGRGVWEYRSFWNWASASGFLADGRTIGLNLGSGFGDTSAATEDCFILNGKIHKLEKVNLAYDSSNYMKPWSYNETISQHNGSTTQPQVGNPSSRLELEFVPFKDRTAHTNLGIITSEVHQLFGKYHGQVISDTGEVIQIRDLLGFAEEHRARW